uniref:acyl carrier protein n=1 Tax=Streptomyces sp. rh254 TaxID=3028730 RepID=UPI003C7E7B6F
MTVQDQTVAWDRRSTAGLTELITGLYQEALSNEGLDEKADFFESGGDSLTAFQITGRIQEALGTEIAVAVGGCGSSSRCVGRVFRWGVCWIWLRWICRCMRTSLPVGCCRVLTGLSSRGCSGRLRRVLR